MNEFPVPDFPIEADGPVSMAFRARHAFRFHTALRFVKQLPYGRNSLKENPLIVINEYRGTCSTKHTLILELARENKFEELKLMQCIFPLGEETVPGTGALLQKNGLRYIPEAHNFLEWRETILDLTSAKLGTAYVDQMEECKEVKPASILTGKTNDLRRYLERWSAENPDAGGIPAETLWQLREECIAALAGIL